jgi:lipoprotein NlpI
MAFKSFSSAVLLLLAAELLGGVCRAQTSDDLTICIKEVEGNPDIVLRSCTSAIESGLLSETNHRSALNNRGIAYRNKGDLQHAIEDFSQAIQLDPNDDQALNNRGAAYMTIGDNDRAIQDYDQAIRLNPEYFIAIKNRAAAHVNKGQFDLAMQDYNRALKLNPTHPMALQTRGILHFFMADYMDALKDEADSVQADPRDAYSAIWLFLAQSRNGQKDALAQLTKNVTVLRMTTWPGPVIQVYMGTAKPEGLVALAKASSTQYSMDRVCEADFYLGEKALLDGKIAEAAGLFQSAVASGGEKTNLEYTGAVNELAQLKLKAQH